MATPHNHAEPGDIASVVLMPGDPLRAQFIAKNFLDNPVCFNQVRNMYGYTGTYQGKSISVMGSGMGMPSIGIYSYELFQQYGVEKIIRIGSAGSYCSEAKVYDVILVEEAYSESSFAKTQNGYDKDKTYPSEKLNQQIEQTAQRLQIPIRKGCIHSSDVFYRTGLDYQELYQKHHCLAVEMESFALFHNASVLGKEAACILTISDSFVDKIETTAEERQNSFTNMMKIALETGILS